jgi:hypothetical protein
LTAPPSAYAVLALVVAGVTPVVGVLLTILGRALAHRADRIDARITALERGQADHGRTLARIEGYLDRTRQRSHR